MLLQVCCAHPSPCSSQPAITAPVVRARVVGVSRRPHIRRATAAWDSRRRTHFASIRHSSCHSPRCSSPRHPIRQQNRTLTIDKCSKNRFLCVCVCEYVCGFLTLAAISFMVTFIPSSVGHYTLQSGPRLPRAHVSYSTIVIQACGAVHVASSGNCDDLQ